jgi:hypothetical protein
VASARTTPLNGNLTFIERLLDMTGISENTISNEAWDISRLVMLPELRLGNSSLGFIDYPKHAMKFKWHKVFPD